jgi:hypothetical protein
MGYITPREALEKARDTFSEYADQHQTKGTPEANVKAARNRELSRQMQEALDELDGK